MFLKLQSFIYSIMFFCGLEFIVLKPSFVYWGLAFLIIISLQEGKKIGRKWRFSILPVFFSLSSVALLYLVSIFFEQQIFIVLSSLMYYFSLFSASRLRKYELDQTARGMNMAAATATIFFTYAGLYGLYLNFLVPLYWLMLGFLIVTLLVSYQHFSTIKPEGGRIVWTYSFLLGLVMAELVWIMSYWPFGYLTTGVIALILYYVLWDVIQSHFLNLLSRKRIVANMVLFSILIAMILISSKWLPMV